MVDCFSGAATLATELLLAQQQSQTPLARLDPQTRAKVLAALAGFIILGFGLITLAWLGGRFTRRYMNQGRSPGSDRPHEDDWAHKPIVPTERPARRQETDPDEE